MEAFVGKLQRDYPDISFLAAETASWSPKWRQITYTTQDNHTCVWTLLHELGHALLDHTTYDSDVNLLRKEVEAWEHAAMLAKAYGVTIDDDHIQRCLDTYRDWLHKRSTCPACEAHGLQRSPNLYHCFNCQSVWKVSTERFCRPYRLKKAHIS